MIDTGSCKTCRYFDSKDWNSEDKNWCRYNDLPAINEGLCEYYEPMLKPCPFCGSTDVKMSESTNYRDYAFRGVYCCNCGMFCMAGGNDENRVKMWNRRVKE